MTSRMKKSKRKEVTCLVVHRLHRAEHVARCRWMGHRHHRCCQIAARGKPIVSLLLLDMLLHKRPVLSLAAM
jgi:hypothetical protein